MLRHVVWLKLADVSEVIFRIIPIYIYIHQTAQSLNFGGPPLVCCPLLLVQKTCSYFSHPEAISSTRNLKTRHVVFTGTHITADLSYQP
jgi:hypothetical protein